MNCSKKILVIILNPDAASSRIRVLNLLPELDTAGLEVEVEVYPKTFRDKLRLFRKCRGFNLVVLQKKMPSPFDLFLLRKNCRKLGYDFDDAQHLPHDSKGSKSRSREVKFRNVIQASDFVIAGNRILEGWAREFGAIKTYVIPSAVETRNIAVKTEYTLGRRFVIGWVGGRVNLPHLMMLAPVLQALQSADIPVELRIVSDDTVEIPGVQVDMRRWDIETQEKEIAQFDVGVMPLPDTLHSAGKCAYKAIQYMASAVPVVASDVGVNRDVVKDGPGFAAIDSGEFINYLAELYGSEMLRKKCGGAGRLRAEKEFSNESVGALLAACLNDHLTEKGIKL
ncbi:glycosyltransferase [Pontiella agarivorans]|uniref:Glycosyltransferase n=1 Tax=Pontiella agarivorans TaxID=3038953 RepID=A0ABU5N1Y8_9BACT|nr:glycosyltransferase [Pontiella agarivorans]MDZ8120413.1 glycosyltransferase [Pontiella agarivorans]